MACFFYRICNIEDVIFIILFFFSKLFKKQSSTRGRPAIIIMCAKASPSMKFTQETFRWISRLKKKPWIVLDEKKTHIIIYIIIYYRSINCKIVCTIIISTKKKNMKINKTNWNKLSFFYTTPLDCYYNIIAIARQCIINPFWSLSG